MEKIALAVSVLACPVGMGLMMWFMMRGMGGDHSAAEKVRRGAALADLREQQRRLASEIEALEAPRSHDDEPVEIAASRQD